jgi:hypothetical protein
VKRRLDRQADGRWLLREGGRCFVVPDRLGRRLQDGLPEPEFESALADLRRGESTERTLWLRRCLLPPQLVVRLAGPLRRLAGWPALGLAATAGVFVYAAGPAAAAAGGGAAVWLPALGLALLAALGHELGHAAALLRAGGTPGGVGVGLLFVLPVLYCDVTSVALLPRRERLRVDAAGLAWHLALGGLLRSIGTPAASLAAWGVLAAAGWNLLPFLRTDGYWLLADALDVRTLQPPAPAGAGRCVRTALGLWRGAHLVFLAVVGAGLAWRLVRLLDWSDGLAPVAAWTARGLLVVVAAACLLGLLQRARGLLRT